MTIDPLTKISTRTTPQTEPVLGRTDQVKNSAGGYVFAVDDWTRATRFIILGTQSGTYYASEQALTKENAEVIFRLANSHDGLRLVDLIVDISLNNRAPKQNQTLFALAVCAASDYKEGDHYPVRQAAYAAISRVCRTGTMLFQFISYCDQFRGWSRGLRRAVGDWYTHPAVSDVAYQVVKYRNRHGYTHRDVLRLAHPRALPPTVEIVGGTEPPRTDVVELPNIRSQLFEWITHPAHAPTSRVPNLAIIEGFLRAQRTTSVREWANLITDYDLPWEALPDEAMNEPAVWEALLPHTGLTALIRQLPRLTRIGMLKPLSASLKAVTDRITDSEGLTRSRVHPYNVLNALVTYAAGRSLRGTATWEPLHQVIDALDASFYAAFGNVVPAHKRTLIGLDVSGSMGHAEIRRLNRSFSYGFDDLIAGSFISPRIASCALSMVTARTEDDYMITAFSDKMVPVTFSPRERLDDICHRTAQIHMGRTDCAQPILFASANNIDVDTFVTYTDSETYQGRIHVFQALNDYRQKVGHDVRSVVVGMTSNGFSIADPKDLHSLDVAGFDGSCPELISSFSRGEI